MFSARLLFWNILDTHATKPNMSNNRRCISYYLCCCTENTYERKRHFSWLYSSILTANLVNSLWTTTRTTWSIFNNISTNRSVIEQRLFSTHLFSPPCLSALKFIHCKKLNNDGRSKTRRDVCCWDFLSDDISEALL